MIIPVIPLNPPPNASETASPIPLTVNIISAIHQADLRPFIRPYVAYSIIKPNMIRKYAKSIPNNVLLNPVGNEFFKFHIASNGVPGMIMDIPIIKAKTAAINTIIATINTPFGLFSIIKSTHYS